MATTEKPQPMDVDPKKTEKDEKAEDKADLVSIVRHNIFFAKSSSKFFPFLLILTIFLNGIHFLEPGN
jgi:hypothetical protein